MSLPKAISTLALLLVALATLLVITTIAQLLGYRVPLFFSCGYIIAWVTVGNWIVWTIFNANDPNRK